MQCCIWLFWHGFVITEIIKEEAREGVNLLNNSNEQVERKIFAVKLQELEQQCCIMKERLRRCQKEEKMVLHQEIQQLIQECQTADALLLQRATESHSVVALNIAKAQQAYNQAIKEILEWDIFTQEYIAEKVASEERSEMMTLYAEYAVDFTQQAMQRSLLALLYSIELQATCEDLQEK